jgi:hypothetical protein
MRKFCDVAVVITGAIGGSTRAAPPGWRPR